MENKERLDSAIKNLKSAYIDIVNYLDGISDQEYQSNKESYEPITLVSINIMDAIDDIHLFLERGK